MAWQQAAQGKAVSGRLPNDSIAYRLSDDVLRLESASQKHPEFWCDIRISEFASKKRKLEPNIVCIVLNQAETEYDGCSTGDVDTSMYFITEDELKSKYSIEVNKSHCVVDGDSAAYKDLVKALESRYKKETEGPFAKVLVVNVHNEGEPDSDYERERDGDSD